MLTRPTPLRVALDLDGTVYDFDRHLRALYCATFARPLPTHSTHYHSPMADTHFDTIDDLLRWYTRERGWYDQPCYPKIRSVVRALLTRPDLAICALTARPGYAYQQTRAALTRDFGPYLNVVHTDRPKHEYHDSFDLWIDDNPHELQMLHRRGLPYLAIDRPWNAHLQHLHPRTLGPEYLYAQVCHRAAQSTHAPTM